MYLTSVDDGIYIHIARIILLIEESGNIFKSFLRTQLGVMPVRIVQSRAEIGLFHVRLNLK